MSKYQHILPLAANSNFKKEKKEEPSGTSFVACYGVAEIDPIISRNYLLTA